MCQKSSFGSFCDVHCREQQKSMLLFHYPQVGLKFLFTLLEYFFWVFHIKQTLVSDFIIHKIATSNRMTHSCLSYKWVLLIFFQGILLMSMSSCLKSKTIPALANETDRLALLDFKNGITQDPLPVPFLMRQKSSLLGQ